MSSALGDFKSVIQTLHELLNVIDREVTETIDSRDPNKVSPTLAPRASAELLNAYKSFTQFSDALASFAADPSDVGVTLVGGFHGTSTIRLVSELGVPDVLGGQELPLSEIVYRVGADEYHLRACPLLSLDHRPLILYFDFQVRSRGSSLIVRCSERATTDPTSSRITACHLSYFRAHEKNLRGVVGHWYV